jgi:signal transduction histidine kinase
MESTIPSSNSQRLSPINFGSNRWLAKILQAWQWLTLVHSDDPLRLILNRGYAYINTFLLIFDCLLLPPNILGKSSTNEIIVILLAIPMFVLAGLLNRRGTVYGAALFAFVTCFSSPLGLRPSEYAGIHPTIHVAFMFPIVIAVLFIRPRAGFVVAALQLMVFAVVLANSDNPPHQNQVFLMTAIVQLASITTVLTVGASIFTNALQASIEANATLDHRVTERTRDLEVAADVSRQITTLLDVQPLLQAVVDRAKVGFNLYYVSVFLYDAEQDQLVLEAGTDRAGEVLKAQGWHFDVQQDQGLVSEVARHHQAMIVNDVRNNPQHFANSQLPQTSAELCLPMLLGDKLIGVLDFQSETVNRFSPDDVRVMTTLAEAVAIAVNNANLYSEQVRVAEQLRSLDTMKSQFLASMSHELRTPLNAILNFTEFVTLEMLGPLNEAQQDALTKSLDSGRHLLALINDVLDMTKIEAGMLTLFIEEKIDLRQELNTVIAATHSLFKDKPVAFVHDIDDNLPLIVGDRRRIRQVLLNLLSNAAKFTEQGSITLSVKSKETELLFAVIDTGPGIAPQDHVLIFEPFQQTEAGIQHAGGTGLGLPISKRLVETHGGRLWLESQSGEGAAFYFTLPIASPVLLEMLFTSTEA